MTMKASGTMKAPDAASRPFAASFGEALLALLLVCAVLLGGGPNEPVWRLAAICGVSCVLAGWTLAHGGAGAFARLPGLVRIGVLAFPCLWLAQLAPLDDALWRGLPGREMAAQVYALAGVHGAHPFSLTASQTLFGAGMVFPGLAAFLATLGLDRRGRQRMVILFLALAGISVLAGLAQLSSRGTLVDFYGSPHKAQLTGFFANRNHQALMLAIAGVFAVSLILQQIRPRRSALTIALVLVLVLLVCVLGTASRAGMVLALGGMAVALLACFGANLRPRYWAMLAGGAAMAAIALIAFNPVARRALSRFSGLGDDSRWQFWTESWPLVLRYFPWGGGLGGFARHYNTTEQLDQVGPAWLNHAHNEYLEVLVEAGLPGIAALLAFGLAFAIVLFGGKQEGAGPNWTDAGFRAPAGLGIALVALHSMVDYPLRTQALAVLFGMMAGLFLSQPACSQEEAAHSRARRIGALAAFVALAAFCIAGFRAEAWHKLQTHPRELELLSIPDIAVPDGLRARLIRRLGAEPYDAEAFNLLYASEVRQGAGPDRRAELAGVLAQLGWRNSSAQRNLIFEAVRRGDTQEAIRRADGLLRRNLLREPLLAALRQLEQDEAARDILAQRLARRPVWRGAYFADVSHLADARARAARRALFAHMQAMGDPPAPAELQRSLDAMSAHGESGVMAAREGAR